MQDGGFCRHLFFACNYGVDFGLPTSALGLLLGFFAVIAETLPLFGKKQRKSFVV